MQPFGIDEHRQSMDRTDFIRRFINIVGNVFDAYSTVLFLPQKNHPNIYRLEAVFSLSDDIPADTMLQAGQGLVGWIIRNAQPLMINNYDKKRGTLGYYVSKGEDKVRAFLGVPVPEGGALCLDSRKTYSFVDKDQKILLQFAELLRQGLKTEEAFSKSILDDRLNNGLMAIKNLRRRYPRWSNFRSAFLELMSLTVGFEFCCLAVPDESGAYYFIEGSNLVFSDSGENRGDGALLKSPMTAGLIGWVFRSANPVYSAGEKDSSGVAPLVGKNYALPPMRTVICEPLIFSRRIRGVLVLADEKPLPIAAEVKEFVELAAEYLSILLENLYLKSKL